MVQVGSLDLLYRSALTSVLCGTLHVQCVPGNDFLHVRLVHGTEGPHTLWCRAECGRALAWTLTNKMWRCVCVCV